VAYRMNGKPLPETETQGPPRIAVPQDKRPARWIQMVDRIEVALIPYGIAKLGQHSNLY